MSKPAALATLTLSVLLAACSGSGGTTKTATSPATHASVAPAVASTSSAPAVSKQATRWHDKMAHDVNIVQVDVQAALAAEDLVAKEQSPSATETYQAAQLAQTAHDDLTNIKPDFAVAADGTGSILTYENEAFGAVNDLKNAMGTLVTYLGDPNAATAAHFTSQYQQGAGEWNDAVTHLWSGAGLSKPPTL